MIWWHGTDKKTSERHLKNGFPEDTFFARHLEDALEYGGEYVFWVFFKENPTEDWQYVSNEIIPSDKILMLIHIDIKKLYYSKDVDTEINKNFIRKNFRKEPCKDCAGRGQKEMCEWLGFEKQCTVCETCQGHGYENFEKGE